MKKVSDEVKFNENGLVPVIVQDDDTNEVLMLAYMNEEALIKTIATKKAYYWSRSRNKLWMKGETSGNYQYVKSVLFDCDKDSILLKVNQTGAACHTGEYSCFFNKLSDENGIMTLIEKGGREPADKVLNQLYNTIIDRKHNPREGSYTNYLFQKGLDKILKKVGEEASEVIIASKNRSREEIRYEISDLMYHLLVLMAETEISPQDIYDELRKRKK